MQEKIKYVLGSRATWAFLATAAGAFGEKYVGITNAIGSVFVLMF